MARKYRSMILGSDFYPEVAMTPWEGIFTVPWLSSDAIIEVGRQIEAKRRERREGLTT
jgi:hypothetical protein